METGILTRISAIILMSPVLFTAAGEEVEPQNNSIIGIKFQVTKNYRLLQMDMKVKMALSQSHCAVLCAGDACCLHANYNNINRSCEMLRYNEIPNQRYPGSQWGVMSTDCQQLALGTSSCQGIVAERGAWKFMTVSGYILKGNDDGIQYGIGLEECRHYCVNLREFQCRSIDYMESTARCHASRSSRDDEGNTLQFYGDGSRYEQRVC